MSKVIIEVVENGWILTASMEGRVNIMKVFNKQEEMVEFLNGILPVIEIGFIETLKEWIKER